jgi:hypothetical protein
LFTLAVRPSRSESRALASLPSEAVGAVIDRDLDTQGVPRPRWHHYDDQVGAGEFTAAINGRSRSSGVRRLVLK